MRDVLLSICISSYNKGNKCVQLVEKLLTVPDDRFNVFLCDDCSDESTVQKLRQLQDPRVSLVQNEENAGPCKNWYKTIDCGDGKYILQILDRDDIDVRMIPDLLAVLEEFSIGAGYIGKAAMSLTGNGHSGRFVICKKGKEAFLTMAGVPIHPTGFLVDRMLWKQGHFRKFFYQDEKYGIYPHSYVLGIIAGKRDMLYMPVPFYTYVYRGENKKSSFYQRSGDKNYWWLPDNIMKTANQLMLYLYHLADDEYKNEFIIRRVQEGLNRATRGYRAVTGDSSEMGHYGMDARKVPTTELLIISAKYYFVFRHVLRQLGIRSGSVKKELNKIWLEDIKSLLAGGVNE